MPPLLCLRLLLVVGVGGIAEEKVGVLRGLFQCRAGGGITREHEPQTPACRAQHIRGSDHRPVFQRDALAPLEQLPCRHRNVQCPGLCRVKAARPGQVEPVAPAGHPVPGAERRKLRPRRPAGGEGGQVDGVCVQLHSPDRVRQRPGQGAQGGPDLPQPLGAVKGQRALPALTAQRLQQARQAEDMVAVIVGQADGIQLHQVDSGAAGRRLRALAAVKQQGMAPTFGQRGGQGTVRQGHGGRRTQQCNGQHNSSSVICR